MFPKFFPVKRLSATAFKRFSWHRNKLVKAGSITAKPFRRFYLPRDPNQGYMLPLLLQRKYRWQWRFQHKKTAAKCVFSSKLKYNLLKWQTLVCSESSSIQNYIPLVDMKTQLLHKSSQFFEILINHSQIKPSKKHPSIQVSYNSWNLTIHIILFFFFLKRNIINEPETHWLLWCHKASLHFN